MAYQSRFETFRAAAPDGTKRAVQFVKAGFLAQGDQPELYFFRVDAAEVIVGVSGDALKNFQRAHRYLSREEKMDVAGAHLKRQIEAGQPLVSENLFIRGPQLELLAGELNILT